jgi:hypothetical protein
MPRKESARASCGRGKVRNPATSRCVQRGSKALGKKPANKRSKRLVRLINSLSGRRVVKVSAKGGVRPSGAQAYRDGTRLGSMACYDGTCKRLKHNGKYAYWG